MFCSGLTSDKSICVHLHFRAEGEKEKRLKALNSCAEYNLKKSWIWMEFSIALKLWWYFPSYFRLNSNSILMIYEIRQEDT